MGQYKVFGTRIVLTPPARLDRRNLVLSVERDSKGIRYSRPKQAIIDKGVLNNRLLRKLTVCVFVEVLGTDTRAVLPLNATGWL